MRVSMTRWVTSASDVPKMKLFADFLRTSIRRIYSMKITHIVSAMSFILVLVATAGPVYAESTPTGRGRGVEIRATKMDERQARVNARQTQNLDRLKEKAYKEIDRRINALNKLIERINAVKRLTADQKSSLVSQVQAEITNLTNLKTKIAADTDLATLRADVQSIVKSYRIYALFIPKMQIVVHADRLLSIVDDFVTITDKLQTRINEEKAEGKDMGEAESLMTERSGKITDAKTQATNAINTVIPLTPDGYPGNKTSLQSARSMLQTARADLREAHKAAQRIRQLLGN